MRIDRNVNTGAGDQNPFGEDATQPNRETGFMDRNKPPRQGSTSEHSEQVRLINWVRKAQRTDERLALLHAIPNGGARNTVTARRLKEEGVLAGIPDLFLPVPVGDKHGLYIELKTKTGRLSARQKEMLPKLAEQGYQIDVCYGHKEAIVAIKKYFGQTSREIVFNGEFS